MSETAEGQRVFLDASVWVAAAGSETGGSSLVLEVCQGRRFAAACSQRVLLEAQRNIRAKLGSEVLARCYRLLAGFGSDLTIVSPVSEAEERAHAELVGAKDAHVIAATIAARACYLLTLDRRHLANERVNAGSLPLEVLTPGEFLRRIVRGHQEGT